MATRAALLSLILIFPPVGVAEEVTNPDPWKGVNQTTFAINETADRYVLKPVSKTYRTVLPGFGKAGHQQFFRQFRRRPKQCE